MHRTAAAGACPNVANLTSDAPFVAGIRRKLYIFSSPKFATSALPA